MEASARDEGFLAARVLRTRFGAGVIDGTVHGEAVLDTSSIASRFNHRLALIRNTVES